ncbi:MAG: sialate O-acetylesterase [Bacteroidetes bacterium]|nr:sialate O-acetylesterase [Bacteroidota bacterium]
MRSLQCTGWLLLLSGFGAAAQVKVPRLVSDGMVLQREIPIRVWGWASPGEKVTVKFGGETVSGETNDRGKWQVTLSPKKAGGPYAMDINGINHIWLKNIMVGEVWVCGGQSNMELPMERVKEKYPEVIARSENTAIRQFRVPMRYDFNGPRENLSGGKWESANPETVLSFSAVGYFFARDINARYHVPVGLINTAVGGTPAEAWLSADALRSFPEYAAEAARYADTNNINKIIEGDKEASEGWYARVWNEDKGLHGDRPWYDPAAAASDWKPIEVPGYWSDQGAGNINGVVWYRKEIDLPASMAGQPARLLLGRIVDRDSVYINGKFTGTIGYQYPPRRYDVPAGLLQAGRNTIVVRVINSEGKGGFVPDKPYRLMGSKDTVDLKGQWTYKVGMVAQPLAPETFIQYKPMGVYNGMIAPITDYTIRGVIWYQGESNVSRAAEYQTLFPAVIADWRRHWNEGVFPFIFVQLAGYGPVKEQPEESEEAALREAQRMTLSVPRTGMAVAMDLGEWNDLHPLDKEDVGRRLALSAGHVAYGDDDMIWTGPQYHSMKVKGEKIHVVFNDAESGLIVKGGGELRGFEVSGADGRWAPAKAVIEGKNVVIAWSDAVPDPVAVRYAWADSPVGANLYNRDILFHDGLPAPSFAARIKEGKGKAGKKE